MKRLGAIGVAIAVPVAVLIGAAVFTARPGPPVAAQGVLAAYVGHRNQSAPAGWHLGQLAVATHPSRLEFTWSRATYGDGPVFRTTWNDRMAPIGATRAAAQPVTGLGPAGNLRPLPYPPTQAWCAQLERGEAAAIEWVVVALHQDLYNAGWVVHELDAGEALIHVSELGCEPAGQE